MFFVNLALAFVLAMSVWLVASQLVASFIYKTETRRPGLAGRAPWHAAETALVFSVFAGSVALWIGLTFWLESLGK